MFMSTFSSLSSKSESHEFSLRAVDGNILLLYLSRLCCRMPLLKSWFSSTGSNSESNDSLSADYSQSSE